MFFLKNKFGLILLLCSLSGSAQEKEADHDFILQSATVIKIATESPDSAIRFARDVLKNSEATENSLPAARALLAMGVAYQQKGDFDSSVFYLIGAKEFFFKMKSTDDIIHTNIQLSKIYIKRSLFTKAVQVLLESDSIIEVNRESALRPDVKMYLGTVYKRTADYERSLEYHLQAVEEFKRQDNLAKYINSVFALSVMYRILDKADSSLAILKRIEDTVKNELNDPFETAMLEEHLGESYFNLNQYHEALNLYNKAYATLKKKGDSPELAYEAYCVGKANKALKKYEPAEKYLLEAFDMNNALNIVNFQYDIADELSALYQKSGDWQNAFKYLQISRSIKEDLGFQRQMTQAANLREKYESEKKTQEILLLKTQNQLSEVNNRRARLGQYLSIILFIASVVISGLLINRGRYKRKLEQQTLRNRIAGDLHDDIGSALSSIDIGSRVALAKKDNPSVIMENLIKINQQARKTMDSMSDIVWSVNPANDSFENILSRMREFANEICEPQQIEFIMTAPEKKNIVIKEADKRRNIFLIFKESVNNACKFSGCTLIEVSFQKSGKNRLLMRITDNGKGFDEELVRKGNGLQNIRNRAQQINASVSIASHIGGGTIIELEYSI